MIDGMRIAFGTFVMILLPTWLFAQDVATMTMPELIRTYVAIQDELRKRKVSTSGSHLTGQLGEYLFTRSFGWEPAAMSQAAYDAQGDGGRIQIKARRVSEGGGHQQLGAIRDLEGFDLLAVVLFRHDYEVAAAALIPVDVVRAHARYDDHTNSWRLMFSDALRAQPEVIDVTERLRSFGL